MPTSKNCAPAAQPGREVRRHGPARACAARFTLAKQPRNTRAVPSHPMDVVLVRWPAEELRRAELREHGVPRLLLVEHGAPPPRTPDDLEDWVRVPADEVDLHARVDNLNRRAVSRSELMPELDDDGVLRA